MTYLKLISKILDGVKKAQNGNLYFQDIYSKTNSKNTENEYLFFIKPEITQQSEKIDLSNIIELILNRISEYELEISNIKILSAKYLEDHNIIANHYGLINRISNNAKKEMSKRAVENFGKYFCINVFDSNILGSFEFLNKYPSFDPHTLDILWRNRNNFKLDIGTYCMHIKLDADDVYLFNGFHPKQMKHFIEAGKSIVVFTLNGNLDWLTARHTFIGNTNPNIADIRSIRRLLLENKELYGLEVVSQELNGVHLSAGPIEGLIELVRYNNNYSSNTNEVSLSDFNFGKLLQLSFNKNQIDKILTNSDIYVDGRKATVFDITEELNSSQAIDVLKNSI